MRWPYRHGRRVPPPARARRRDRQQGQAGAEAATTGSARPELPRNERESRPLARRRGNTDPHAGQPPVGHPPPSAGKMETRRCRHRTVRHRTVDGNDGARRSSRADQADCIHPRLLQVRSVAPTPEGTRIRGGSGRAHPHEPATAQAAATTSVAVDGRLCSSVGSLLDRGFIGTLCCCPCALPHASTANADAAYIPPSRIGSSTNVDEGS